MGADFLFAPCHISVSFICVSVEWNWCCESYKKTITLLSEWEKKVNVLVSEWKPQIYEGSLESIRWYGSRIHKRDIDKVCIFYESKKLNYPRGYNMFK